MFVPSASNFGINPLEWQHRGQAVRETERREEPEKKQGTKEGAGVALARVEGGRPCEQTPSQQKARGPSLGPVFGGHSLSVGKEVAKSLKKVKKAKYPL